MKKNFKRLLLKAKREVFSENVGNNSSNFLGEGYDFSELREYQIGDDIRHIDWIISAKLQKPYVKLFRAERELNVGIVLALGGSMEFGVRESKKEIAGYLSALLAFFALKNGDPFYVYCFSDKEEFFIPPNKSFNRAYELMDKLGNVELQGKRANLQSISEILLQRVKKRSLLFVISDFFEGVNLKALNKKHEVVALAVRDRFEEEPSELGSLDIIDPVSGIELEFDFSKESIARYKNALKKRDAEIFGAFKRDGIRIVKIFGDKDIYSQLREIAS